MVMEVRSVTNGGSTGNVVLAAPTGHQANDIFLLLCESNVTEVVAAPTGYTAIPGSPWANGDTRLSVFWKRATSSSEGSTTVVDPGNHLACHLMAIKEAVTSGSPFESIVSDTSLSTPSVNVTCPAVTPAGEGRMVMHITGQGTDTSANQLASVTTPEFDTTVPISAAAYNTSLGGGGGIVRVAGIAAQGGVTVNSFITLATAARQINLSIVFIPDLSTYVSQVQVGRVNMGFPLLPDDFNRLSVNRINLGFVLKPGAAPVATRRRGFMHFVP